MELETLIFYNTLSENERIYFLSSLMYELTIIARNFYLEDKVDNSSNFFQTINELQHKISSHIRHLLKKEDKRYPDDVLFKILFQIAGDYGYMTIFKYTINCAKEQTHKAE